MSSHSLFFLGTPKIEFENSMIRLERQKSLALLAYLALASEPRSRAELATLLWPEAPSSKSLASLRRALTSLRQAFGNEIFSATQFSLGLKKGGFWLDVAQFQSRLELCGTHGHPISTVCPTCLPWIGEAVDLVRGDFMAGFSLRDSAPFEEWQIQQTAQFRNQYFAALDKLVIGFTQEQEIEKGIRYAFQWLKVDPFQEKAQRYLMQLYALNGQRELALRQYEESKGMLARELGILPQQETITLYHAILSGKPLPPLFHSIDGMRKHSENGKFEVTLQEIPKATSVPPAQFPIPLTCFCGRKEELTFILLRLQAPDCRLLTLTGMGGIGKTRLALEVAHTLAQNSHQLMNFFPNGLYFVSLEALNEPDCILPAIANQLELTLNNDATLQTQFIKALEGKKLLLILDNFEHLLGGAMLINDILTAIPGLKILTTSREKLALQEEWTYEIRGLEYPALESIHEEIQTLEAYSAIQLFLHRARRSNPTFALGSDNAAWIVKICQWVQGLPLGVELATEAIRYASCQAMAENPEDTLMDFHTPCRNLPTRHASLRAVFKHSWQLLTPQEQATYPRLSVFREGFTLPAAEAVGIKREVVFALMDKSLVYDRGTGRYDLHPVLRQMANEKLSGSI